MALAWQRRFMQTARLLALLPALAGVAASALAAQSAAPAAPAALAAPAAAVAPAVASVAKAVGTVSLSIGVSELRRAGKALTIARGSAIAVGDTISTSPSGHVHIQFVDGAHVSVRPDSVLRVETYQYDPAHPAASTVKFFLEKGVVRAISGAAAHAARDRFRLNTPLVAIGVRGTDFTTRAGPRSAVVVVNQGAIVLAPLDAGCPAAGLGPCGGSRARTLTASMRGIALVYRGNGADPSFQPLNTLRGTDKIAPIMQIMQQEREGAAQSATVVADSAAPTSVTPLLPVQHGLIWGRWSNAAAPGDNLTVPFMAALQGKQVTVGDGYYFLFRNETGPNLISAAGGQASFSLQGGSAYYRSTANEFSAASIQGGTLGIDFARDTFATSLTMSSAATGPVALSASGTLNPANGIFLSATPGPHVAGALSFNTLQAGYLFSNVLANGATLSGATLWGR